MRNIKLTIQYDGTGFAGYELQPGKRTVRGEMEKALFKLFKKKIKLISSSRTDSGVHSVGSVVNFKLLNPIPTDNLQMALNSRLPEDVRVIGTRVKGQEFNARFGAKSKTYEYLIYNGPVMPVHLRNIAWHIKQQLDLSAMKKAARHLVGKHDFTSFCAAHGDDKDKVREIHQLVISHSSLVIWGETKVPLIRIRITGNGFLYKMVRNIVGTLVEVGRGTRDEAEVKTILNAKNRCLAGKTAPAHGLCLIKVCYN
ncbi:MAG: tRNA pseudouridine(38-40) synthase TruA [Candidatus Margulisbacteria bacterium]|nr:tRNA pseudouridine(38-40) synthase TruA [Candidatus Margulisiibacteriota bacterium]